MRKPSICEAAEYVAEDLLQGEGFTEVRYVEAESFVDSQQALVAGKADLTMLFSPPFLLRLEAGDPLVVLAGVHVGCFELFGSAVSVT
jgi:NitT/TauT family transport system substrate-binding protein